MLVMWDHGTGYQCIFLHLNDRAHSPTHFKVKYISLLFSANQSKLPDDDCTSLPAKRTFSETSKEAAVDMATVDLGSEKIENAQQVGFSSLLLILKLQLPWVTKTEFLLTISIEYQTDKWWA